MTLLRRAADDLGKTVVVVLHDINFASCSCDHIVAMRCGKVLCQGTPDEIMQPAPLRDIYETDIAVKLIGGKRIAVYSL